jgi:hypothetical protein
MYSMVMMMSVAGAGDMASFGGRGNGCGGCGGAVVVASNGCSGSSCRGGHGFLGGRHSCHGSSCSGVVVASSGCSGNSCNGGGLFAKHRAKKASCCGSVAAADCCTPAPAGCCGAVVASPCSGGAVVAMPAEKPAAEMVKPEAKPAK